MKSSTKVRLDARNRFALTQFVHTNFATSKLDDAAFAKLAEDQLGVLVTRSHISSIRRAFDIPANKSEVRGGSRLKALEGRVTELESFMEVILRERREKHGNGH